MRILQKQGELSQEKFDYLLRGPKVSSGCLGVQWELTQRQRTLLTTCCVPPAPAWSARRLWGWPTQCLTGFPTHAGSRY